MKLSPFEKILIALVCAGVLLTVLHAAYILYAYPHSSIVYFIGKELW